MLNGVWGLLLQYSYQMSGSIANEHSKTWLTVEAGDGYVQIRVLFSLLLVYVKTSIIFKNLRAERETEKTSGWGAG